MSVRRRIGAASFVDLPREISSLFDDDRPLCIAAVDAQTPARPAPSVVLSGVLVEQTPIGSLYSFGGLLAHIEGAPPEPTRSFEVYVQ